jgi:phage N-6-adenine-methyltransferase
MAGKKHTGFAHEDRRAKKHEWGTPATIFELLNIMFDLDPCHPQIAYSIPIDNWCHAWYTKEDDGLKSPWFGRVFMNPPYGDGIIHWMAKMHEHANGIALVFARTDVKWYRQYALQADAILYLKTRLKFIDMNDDKDEEKAKNGAGAGSMLVAWGDDNVAALANLAHLGDFRDLRIERLFKSYAGKPLNALTTAAAKLLIGAAVENCVAA